MTAYDAFISYSHANDKPIAAALQAAMQKLGKPWYRRRALRIFRDDTSLAATPELWPAIERALAQSRFLVILASPQFAASKWCGLEVAYWLQHKSIDTLLVGLTEGDLVWDAAASDFHRDKTSALTPALHGQFRSEPKWIDLRDCRADPARNGDKFSSAAADLAAAIHGVPKEDLLSQELKQQKRALALASVAASGLLVLTGVAGWQWYEADAAKRTAEISESQARADRDRAEQNFGLAQKASEELVIKITRGLRDVHGMRADTTRQILETTRSVLEGLEQSTPGDPRLRQTRGSMLMEFAVTYLAAGDNLNALAAAKQSLEAFRELGSAVSPTAQQRFDISAALNTLSDVTLDAGDAAAARGIIGEALRMRRQLLAAEPANEQWERGLAASLDRNGRVQSALGDYAGALSAFNEGLAIFRRRAATNPGEAERQADLAAGLSRIGDIRGKFGDRTEAIAAYAESLNLLQKIVAAAPSNTAFRRNASVVQSRLADLQFAAGSPDSALASYRESLAITRGLLASDASNTLYLDDAGVVLGRIADVQLQNEGHREAKEASEEAVVIYRRLNQMLPGNPRWSAALRGSLWRLGRQVAHVGDRGRMLPVFDELLRHQRALIAANPSDIATQRDLTAILFNLGDAKLMSHDTAGGRALFDEALSLSLALLKQAPDDSKRLLDVALSHSKIANERLTVRDFPGAFRALGESLAIHRRLAAAAPSDGDEPLLLADALTRYADLKLELQGDRTAAAPLYEESVALRRRFVASAPNDVERTFALILNLSKLSAAAEAEPARLALEEAHALTKTLEQQGKLDASKRNWPRRHQQWLAGLPAG